MTWMDFKSPWAAGNPAARYPLPGAAQVRYTASCFEDTSSQDGRPSPERDCSLKEGTRVPKPNYQFEKRKKDLQKKKKQDEKRMRKAEKTDQKAREDGEAGGPPIEGGEIPT